MLDAIHAALDTLLRDRGGIDPLDVDVRFDVPSEERVSSLTRPTVNLFLFEVNENTEKRDSAPQTTVSAGRAERRMPPRRIDLFYMVSVLTADIEDEHALLWRVMATLLKYQQFPPEVLPEALRSVSPPLVARLAAKEERRDLLELWTSLGNEPRPALCYVVTAPMDLSLAVEAPLVLTRTARYRRLGPGGEATRDVGIQIGGIVKTRGGQPLADVAVMRSGTASRSVTTAEGRFVLRGVPEGHVTLTVARDGREQTVEVRVPGESYDIVLDG
jgi:hypothetical protein